jgi:predicted nucleotidyltransferase component of viral defense system
MTTPERGGSAESIRHRLRNALRERGEDVSLGLQRYASERFLYRLGRSAHRERFVLKGATLFAIWGTTYRPTRDLDFTAYGDASVDAVLGALRDVCNTPDDVDALQFEAGTVTTEPIRDGSEYPGLRVHIIALLGTSRIPIQLDLGFGNAIVPGPEEVEYRTLLGDAPPRILAYPQESVVAEKLHAMVTLGLQNSRYKDFYDVYTMANAFGFERSTLVAAVRATFERRATPFPDGLPVALRENFYADGLRAEQWRAYVTSRGMIGGSKNFAIVGERILALLRPVWEDAITGAAVRGDWAPEEGWL